MVVRLADNRDPKSWASRLRARRIRLFERLIAPLPDPVRVLDVGGSPQFWRLYRDHNQRALQLTLVNLDRRLTSPDHDFVYSDARDMGEFADNSFDACFSNSLLEHVGTFCDQQRVAAEIRRVAPIYLVQTPYRHFPLEAHFLMPGFQYLPTPIRATLHQHFHLGWVARQPDPRLARTEVEQFRLLTRREMGDMFPDARIVHERIGPLTKALLAVRAPGWDGVCP